MYKYTDVHVYKDMCIYVSYMYIYTYHIQMQFSMI